MRFYLCLNVSCFLCFILLYSVLLCIIMYYVLCIIMYYFIMYYCLMYLFCWCLSEFHPSIDLSFAFLLPTTTFHVAGVGWSVQVHSLSGGLSKTSSAAWTNAYFKCSSPSLATLFLCLSLEFCRILRWPKSQFGWRRLRNLCILQLDYVFAYVTLIKYTYYYYYYYSLQSWSQIYFNIFHMRVT